MRAHLAPLGILASVLTLGCVAPGGMSGEPDDSVAKFYEDSGYLCTNPWEGMPRNHVGPSFALFEALHEIGAVEEYHPVSYQWHAVAYHHKRYPTRDFWTEATLQVWPFRAAGCFTEFTLVRPQFWDVDYDAIDAARAGTGVSQVVARRTDDPGQECTDPVLVERLLSDDAVRVVGDAVRDSAWHESTITSTPPDALPTEFLEGAAGLEILREATWIPEVDGVARLRRPVRVGGEPGNVDYLFRREGDGSLEELDAVELDGPVDLACAEATLPSIGCDGAASGLFDQPHGLGIFVGDASLSGQYLFRSDATSQVTLALRGEDNRRVDYEFGFELHVTNLDTGEEMLNVEGERSVLEATFTAEPSVPYRITASPLYSSVRVRIDGERQTAYVSHRFSLNVGCGP